MSWYVHTFAGAGRPEYEQVMRAAAAMTMDKGLKSECLLLHCFALPQWSWPTRGASAGERCFVMDADGRRSSTTDHCAADRAAHRR